jgi:type IV secretory pathway TrbL component
MVSKGVRLHAGSIATQKEVKEMNPIRRILVGAAVAGSLLTGGVVGAAIAGPLAASAATTSNVAATAATPSAASGTFVPNENATHEAGESAAREAQENAGQVPSVP